MSDNAAGVSPEILAAIAAANSGAAPAYGNDAWTERAETAIRELFEAPDAIVLFTATGTAANALALAHLVPPYGAVYGHAEAHAFVDECGAPEMFTGGAKLLGLDGADGKVAADDLARALAEPTRGVHQAKASAVTITQASEAGTLYDQSEIRAIAEVTHAHGLHLHMDGARFANAAAAMGVSPAEMTWLAGVDALSFGASKNGALMAEAVVVFQPDAGALEDLSYRRKRAGHLLSKMRFVAAQFEAYLSDDLWLRNARHANAQAARLAEGLTALTGAKLRYPVQANELFVTLPEAVIRGLEDDGFGFYRWPGEGATLIRLVTSFATQPKDVDALLSAAARHAVSGTK